MIENCGSELATKERRSKLEQTMKEICGMELVTKFHLSTECVMSIIFYLYQFFVFPSSGSKMPKVFWAKDRTTRTYTPMFMVHFVDDELMRMWECVFCIGALVCWVCVYAAVYHPAPMCVCVLCMKRKQARRLYWGTSVKTR